jgi:hypothetical protein
MDNLASIYRNSMSLKKPLVWFLLIAMFFGVWAEVLHAHGNGAPELRAASTAADADLAQEGGNSDSDIDGSCHCFWCAPQLHAAVAATDQFVRIALLEAAASPPPWPTTAVAPAAPRGSVPPPRGPPLRA